MYASVCAWRVCVVRDEPTCVYVCGVCVCVVCVCGESVCVVRVGEPTCLRFGSATAYTRWWRGGRSNDGHRNR